MSKQPSKAYATAIAMLALAGCTLTPPARPMPAPGEYCRIARPIEYDSTADSPETVAAIERHNSQWACVCEGDCPIAPSVGGNGDSSGDAAADRVIRPNRADAL